MRELWKPIDQLEDKYNTKLLLCAPELVDPDCNPDGIGMGYWQDGPVEGITTDNDVRVRKDVGSYPSIRTVIREEGSFLCCKWNMTSDVWNEVMVTPTHFLILEGPNHG